MMKSHCTTLNSTFVLPLGNVMERGDKRGDKNWQPSGCSSSIGGNLIEYKAFLWAFFPIDIGINMPTLAADKDAIADGSQAVSL
jgi:hypothetical protein